MIGVLGGMGPFATCDFFAKVLEETAARRDEDNVPLLIHSDPRIPSRPEAILAGGASPLRALVAARDRLIGAGATALAMPCNTAHHWYGSLVSDCSVPFISIVEASCDALAARLPAGASVALLATRATLAAGLFEAPLARRRLKLVEPGAAELDELLLPCIEHVKAGRSAEAAPLLRDVVHRMTKRGAQAVLLACTELPIAWDALPTSESAVPCVDSTRELARECVRWWRASRGAAGSA